MSILARFGLTVLITPFYLLLSGGWAMMVMALLGLFDQDLHHYTETTPTIFGLTLVGHVGVAVVNAIGSRIESPRA